MALSMGLLGGAGFIAPAGSFDLLETQVLTSTAASVTFASLGTLASEYQHLQIRAVTRQTASLNSQMGLRINGVSSGYSEHLLAGNGSSVTTFGGTGAQFIPLGGSLTTQTSNAFDARIIDILDPFSTSKNTTVREFLGFAGSANTVGLFSGAFFNTQAVTNLSLHVTNSSIAQFSRFSLYGIKAD